MPLNSIPVTTTVEAFDLKKSHALGNIYVDCGFWGGVVPGNHSDLPGLAQAGVLGAKCFLIHSGLDDFPEVDRVQLLKSMPLLKKAGIPLLVHAELDCGHSQTETHPQKYSSFLESRPHEMETKAIEMMIELCRETGTHVHIVHLSSAEALPMIRQAKADKLPFTVETCPHYLSLNSDTIEDGATQFKCMPPIRDATNAEKLWLALSDGTIDFIVSDHSPCIPQLKKLDSGDFLNAWGGISALQFSLPVIWTEALKRNLTIQQVVTWLSLRTAQFTGLQKSKGRIAQGYDADMVVFDPDAEFEIMPGMIHHKHKVTPYSDRKLRGKVLQTYLRGAKIFERGEFLTSPLGQFV